KLLCPVCAHGALNVICRRYPEEAYDPARTIDLRLAWRGALLLGKSRIGVGGSDFGHAGSLRDGHRGLGGSCVIGPDVDHGVRVGHGLVGILRLHSTIPLARLR